MAPTAESGCSNAARGSRGRVNFSVGGETFQLAKPFLSIHSPTWKQRFSDDPELSEVELGGDAESFRSFSDFLQGVAGEAGDVTADNVLSLLHWGKEFDIDYVSSQCESFLVSGWGSSLPAGLEHIKLVEIAARYNMPTLYAKAMESAAHGMHYVDVESAEAAFASEDIREDLLNTQVSMGLARSDLEARRRLGFANHAQVPEAEQRARVLWKSRARRAVPEEPEPPPDWKATQTTLPHPSLYGDDYIVKPQRQPQAQMPKPSIRHPPDPGHPSAKEYHGRTVCNSGMRGSLHRQG